MGHLWLIGMMGSGKTEVGRRVADMLALPFVDTDDDVRSRLGRSIAAVWDERGEAGFRDLEEAEIARVAAATGSRVVATGGGAVLREGNIAAMRSSGVVVWLTAPPEVLAARVGDGHGRPLLAGDASAEALAAVLSRRRDRYRAAADWEIETSGRAAPEVASEVAGRWRVSS